jgi:3-methyladenine DNA glycosylase AlkC
MAQATSTGAPALKEIFNRDRLAHIAALAANAAPRFETERFLALASDNLDALSIMQRLRQIAVSLRAVLPGPFEADVDILRAMAPNINHGFASMILPEYVALYGQEHFDVSMAALKYFTQFGSSEFAIRHFLLADQARALAVMEQWAHDDSEHARRLASEGARPRLPWSFQLKALMADPSPTATILETLNRDPSLYVRKSVANHLNDITKDHPDVVLAKFRAWPLDHKHTSWIVKHALRNMIKQGHPEALSMIGATGAALVSVSDFTATPAALALGERLELSARIVSTGTSAQRLVIDYAMHYVKKGATPSRKVFKLKELTLAPGERQIIAISQVIRDFSTRKHYAGHHRIELLVNGVPMAETGFTLTI